MKLWGWVAAVVAFGLGVGFGEIGARGVSRDAEAPSGPWGVVQVIDRPGDAPRFHENVQITFADRSREDGLVVRGYAHTDPQGTYPRDRAAPPGTKLRSASAAGYDFASMATPGAPDRVDFLGHGRPHEIDLQTSTGADPEQGVMVTPVGRNAPLWFGRDHIVRLHSGSYDLVLHDLHGPIGSSQLVCFGEKSRQEIPITLGKTTALTVRVRGAALPTGLVARALRLPNDGVPEGGVPKGGDVPPPEVLARSGFALTRQEPPTDGASDGVTFRGVTSPGRYLVGVDDGTETFVGARTIEIGASPGSIVDFTLPEAATNERFALRVVTPGGEPLRHPKLEFRARVHGENVAREVSYRPGADGRLVIGWPRGWDDAWRQGIGNPELTVSSPDRHPVRLTPSDLRPNGETSVVLRGRATLEVRLTLQPSQAELAEQSLFATLEAALGEEVDGDVPGRDEIVPLVAAAPDAGYVARFGETVEGSHRVVIRVRNGDGSEGGVHLVDVPARLTPGENQLDVELPDLGRLELDPHDLPRGVVLVIERLLRGPTHERVAERQFEAERIAVGPLPFGDYLVHLHRADGRYRTSRWIRLDAAEVHTVVDDRRPNAMLVLPVERSPVVDAGFQWGDVIVEIGGEPIRSERLRALLLGLEEGAVSCRVRRGEETLDLSLDFEEAVDTDEGRPELRPIRWTQP